MDIQKTVLVVDDSTTNRSILCDILHSDYTVIQAENGISLRLAWFAISPKTGGMKVEPAGKS